MLAACLFPLTSNKILLPNSENFVCTYPIATGELTLGPKVPLVITPISSPLSEKILVFSLAIIFPSGWIPTLIFCVPCSNSFLIVSKPLNPPSSLLFFGIAHFKFASIGLIFSFRSCPYKHNPASNLSVSLAPKPIGLTPFSIKRLINFSTFWLEIDTSNPSSPV